MPRAQKPSAKGLSDTVVPYVATSPSSNGRSRTPTKGLRKMKEATWASYAKYAKAYETVVVEGKDIRLEGHRRVKTFGPGQDEEQQSTVWSFPDRGNWATHKASYRGNWSPWVPRNLILKYSEPGDTVLDQMVGGGTTLVECKLLGRRAIGVDINRDSLMLAMDRLNFDLPTPMDDLLSEPLPEIKLFQGDARRLDAIPSDSIDLIATHPPYANIIPYSKAAPIEGDLSQVHTLNDFFDGMAAVAAESLRVLKPGGYAGILIGDTHKYAHYVPMAYRTLGAFLQAGFILKEDVIKLQHNVQTARTRWRPWFLRNFLDTMHEHLFIFRKLRPDEDERKFSASRL
ncbi:MAG: DNA methyltransferase [Chloroflexi bacterium]|nr:DNA methyltransferase [Chloroflexota bacterium]